MAEETKQKAGWTIAVGSVFGLAFGLDPEFVISKLGAAAESQIAQTGFFFTLAAWLHAGRVRKEIEKQFSIVTNAINNVATALRQDLETQGKRISLVEAEVIKIKEELK